METARLFTALWPTPHERAEAAAWTARCRWPAHATVVAPERLHVTLHFLGAVGRDRIGDVLAALPRPMPRFTLCFDTPALWRGGTLVMQAREAPPALVALHAELGDRLAALGLKPDPRRYRPHLTLARRANGTALPAEVPALRWRPSRVVLVESVQGGATHYRIVTAA